MDMVISQQNPVSRAIELVGLQEFAKQREVTYVAVRKWGEFRVPAEHVLEVDRLTGGKVARPELRPDP